MLHDDIPKRGTWVLWPDNDPPGFAAMRRVADAAPTDVVVEWIHPPEGLDKKGDAADLPLETRRSLIAARSADVVTRENGDNLTILIKDVEPEEIEYVWAPYFPKSKITQFSGRAKAGKSYLVLDIAARLARGATLPGDSRRNRKPTKTLWIGREDGLADTIRPRWDTLGGPTDALRAVQWEDQPNLLLSSGLVDSLLSEIDESYGLVVVDSLRAWVRGKTDGDFFRNAYDVLAPFCAEGRAVVVLCHNRKDPDFSDVMDLAEGSIQSVAGARSSVMIKRESQDREGGVTEGTLAHVSLNVGVPGLAQKWAITNEGVEWTGIDDRSPEEIFGADATKENQAKKWLAEYLADGPIKSTSLLEAAEQENFSRETLQNAKRGVARSYRDGKVWVWKLV